MQRTRVNSEPPSTLDRARGSRWGGSLPGHGAIGLDAVLEAVELPAGVADLDPGLPDVDADDLPHRVRCRRLLRRLGFLPWGGGLGLEENGTVAPVSFPNCVRSGDKKGAEEGGRWCVNRGVASVLREAAVAF
jgi:hypothetical protein